MGGFYGLKATPEAGFAAIALLCPADENTILEALDEMEQDRSRTRSTEQNPPFAPESPLPRWDTPALRLYFESQSSEQLAARIECPVLLVHARGDEVVPFSHSLLLARCLPGETTLLALQGGTHTTAQHDPRVHLYTVDWLLNRTAEQDDRPGPQRTH